VGYPPGVLRPGPPAVEETPSGERDLPSWVHRLRFLTKLALLAVAVALTIRLAGEVGWTDLVARMRAARWPYLLVALGCLMGRFVVWELRWRLTLTRLGAVPDRTRGFFILLAAAFANHVTPSLRFLGGVLRARYLSRGGIGSFASLYGAILFDQLSYHLFMLGTTWLAVIALAVELGRSWLAAAAALIPPALAAALFAWARHSRRSPGKVLLQFVERRLPREGGPRVPLMARAQEVVRTFRRLLSDPGLLLRVVPYGAGVFLFYAGAQWAVFHALGRPVGVAPILICLAIGASFGAFTGTPGGAGTTEAAMIACYVTLGVEQEAAVAGTLLFRGLHYAQILLLGAPALLYFESRSPAVR